MVARQALSDFEKGGVSRCLRCGCVSDGVRVPVSELRRAYFASRRASGLTGWGARCMWGAQFTLPEGWATGDGGQIRIAFQGVDSAFYCWVNGQLLGYSQVRCFTAHENWQVSV